MDKFEQFCLFYRNYGTLSILLFIGVLYYIIYVMKGQEGFSVMNDHTNLTCQEMNNKIVFLSGVQERYFSIFDKFYCYIYDDICFEQSVYVDQATILKKYLEPNNLYVQKVLINDAMTGHIYGLLYNLPCKLFLTNSTPTMTNQCNRIYPNSKCEYVNMLHTDSYRNHLNFTCVANFSTKLYYYNQSELKQYFKNVSNLLVVKGYFILAYISDFSNLHQLYGVFNKSKNTYLRRNFTYRLTMSDKLSKVVFDEYIYKRNSKGEPKKNVHHVNKYSLEKLVKCAKLSNLDLFENIQFSASRKCFGFLIFKKSM